MPDDPALRRLSVEETEQAVATLAGLLADGTMTVLLVEHDMEVVFRLARMITVLHRGAVIADGSPEVVRASRMTAYASSPARALSCSSSQPHGYWK